MSPRNCPLLVLDAFGFAGSDAVSFLVAAAVHGHLEAGVVVVDKLEVAVTVDRPSAPAVAVAAYSMAVATVDRSAVVVSAAVVAAKTDADTALVDIVVDTVVAVEPHKVG